MTPEPRTLLEALERAAAQVPDRGVTLFDRRGQSPDFRSYAALLASIRQCAGRLAAAGVGVGDRVLICLPTSWELFEVFFGAMWRGAYPTLLAPPGALGGAEAHAKKIGMLVELMGSKRFICEAATRKELVDFNVLKVVPLTLSPAELAALAPASDARFPRPAPDELAFMQLTSGSTGCPRAVMIKHASAVHNAHAIGRTQRLDPFSDRSVVSWLPLNHDMGLVGCVLFPIVYGLNLFLLRPDTFLARPRVWLQLLSSQRDVVTPAPNFAYQLCAERVSADDAAALDLSGWTYALTGAEMVRPETCQAFVEKFQPRGFRPEAFMPCYGLAESTLVATCDTRGRGMRTVPAAPGQAPGLNLSALVCNGAPVLDTEVRICAASAGPNALAQAAQTAGRLEPVAPSDFLGEAAVGEVWIKGPGVFAGYYNDPAATAEALHDGWLRTGDLGFLKEGELYLTGRTKDVLIIHGHNFMPHELEWLAEGASGGGGTERCGAFSVALGAEGEQAVVVLEIAEGDPAALAALDSEIRARIGKALGLPLADVIFVRRGQIPKTTSGKVQRGELRRRYLAGELERR